MPSRLPHKIGGLAISVILAMCALGAATASAQPTYRGFQLHSLWYGRSISEMQRELEAVQQLGGNVIRVDVGWSTLESEGKGSYSRWYLEKLDRLMQEASERQIKVIATLVSTPCWASSAPESLKQGCEGAWWERGVAAYPPTNPQDYGDAAHFLTARYGTELAALEVWNEPDTSRFLVSSDRASSYAELVKAAYPAAKAGNPDVPVVVGALAAADRPFLEELYARGIQGFYDGISIHPYNEWRDPYDRWQPQWKQYTFLPGMEWVHEAQVAAGDSTPLWITEFGWDTCSEGRWCITESQQAEYMVKAFRILNSLGYVYAATAYELRDESTDPHSFEGNWGLLHQDFTEKPAFAAVKEELHHPSQDVTLDLKVSNHGTVYATGEGPQTRPLTITVGDCRRSGTAKRHLARPNQHGLYRRRIGKLMHLRGCRVSVYPGHQGVAVSSRVSRSRRICRRRLKTGPPAPVEN